MGFVSLFFRNTSRFDVAKRLKRNFSWMGLLSGVTEH